MQGDLEEKKIRSRDIPDGNIEVIINFGSSFKKIEANEKTEESKNGGIKGQFDHPVIIEQAGNVDIIGVSFKPYGIYPFITPELSEITNLAGPLDLLIDDELKSRLFEGKRSGNWVRILDQVLASKIDLNQGIHPVLLGTMHDLVNSTRYDIRQLCKDYGLSAKSLQRLYKAKVGITPKQFARIIRIRKLLKSISNMQKPDWMKLVIDFDFYDRSHLCKEFHALTGINPTAYCDKKDTFSSNYRKQA